MTKEEFAPKGEEQIKTEILEATGMDYEENKEVVDTMVARELEGENKKKSFHDDKVKHKESKDKANKYLEEAGFDPETGKKKEAKDPKESPKGDNLDILDIRALNDVHDEDIEEVRNQAKIKGVSVVEIKKDPYMQSYLTSRTEERETAAAANTGSGQGGNKEEITGDAAIDKINTSKDPSDQEFEAAAKARQDAKKEGANK